MAGPRKLKVHPSLAGKSRQGPSGTDDDSCIDDVQIEGYVAPSREEGVIEIWEDINGNSRISVAERDITGSKQDKDGLTTLRVRPEGRIQYESVYKTEQNALFLSGDLMSRFSDDLSIAVGTPKAKPPKWCKTLPIWKCVASGIVVATSTICTLTWPCETDDDNDEKVLQKLTRGDGD